MGKNAKLPCESLVTGPSADGLGWTRLLVLSALCQAALRGWLLLFSASCLSAAQRSLWSGGSHLQFQFVQQHHSAGLWCTNRAAARALEAQQAARGVIHSQSFGLNFFVHTNSPLQGFHLGPGEDLFALKWHTLVHIHDFKHLHPEHIFNRHLNHLKLGLQF